MAQQVRGVVARAKGEPVTVETITVPDPGPGEAVVKIQACGVCHTDLHYKLGGINDEFPFLLGHEAAGIVESVGEGVADLQAGDYLVLNGRAVCGVCRACDKAPALRQPSSGRARPTTASVHVQEPTPRRPAAAGPDVVVASSYRESGRIAGSAYARRPRQTSATRVAH